MKTKDIKKGISLIVLIVTIIVVIILAAAVILTLSKNNPIESAKEARFKEDVRTFQDELALTVSKQYTTAGGHRDDKITTSDFDEIQGYIPSFSEKYRDKFVIKDDELVYTTKLDEKEKEYAQNLNVKAKPKLLPDEYQQVEYIESTGTQYIDLHTKLSNNNKVDVDYAFKDINLIGAIFGAQSNKNGFTINTNVESNSRFGSYSYIAYIDSSFKRELNTRYNIVFSIKGFYQDGNKLWSPPYNEFETSVNGYLFKANGATSVGPMKIYKFKLYDGEDLIRNLIVCKRKSDNQAGLYDTVEGKFYTNQGTGEFIAGPDVNE